MVEKKLCKDGSAVRDCEHRRNSSVYLERGEIDETNTAFTTDALLRRFDAYG